MFDDITGELTCCDCGAEVETLSCSCTARSEHDGCICDECLETSENESPTYPNGHGYFMNRHYGLDIGFRECRHGAECICAECCNERGELP